VLGARLLFEGVANDARNVARAAQRDDREANAERVLRATVAALEVTGGQTQSFTGDAQTARFTSWCDSPGGWQERCAATLALKDSAAPGLVLTLANGMAVRVREGFKHGELRYLSDAHDGGTWTPRWASGFTVPLAVGVVLDSDTLILRVGERQ
jgi:hypothetical protein